MAVRVPSPNPGPPGSPAACSRRVVTAAPHKVCHVGCDTTCFCSQQRFGLRDARLLRSAQPVMPRDGTWRPGPRAAAEGDGALRTGGGGSPDPARRRLADAPGRRAACGGVITGQTGGRGAGGLRTATLRVLP